jgi:hypothetical protein
MRGPLRVSGVPSCASPRFGRWFGLEFGRGLRRWSKQHYHAKRCDKEEHQLAKHVQGALLPEGLHETCWFRVARVCEFEVGQQQPAEQPNAQHRQAASQPRWDSRARAQALIADGGDSQHEQHRHQPGAHAQLDHGDIRCVQQKQNHGQGRARTCQPQRGCNELRNLNCHKGAQHRQQKDKARQADNGVHVVDAMHARLPANSQRVNTA